MFLKQGMTAGIKREGLSLTKAFMLGLLFNAGFVLASSGGGSMPWEGPLDTLVQSLSGPVAGFICLLAIVAAGATLIFAGGEMSQFIKSILYLVIIMAMLMGAPSLMTAFGWSSAVLPREIPADAAAAIKALAG